MFGQLLNISLFLRVPSDHELIWYTPFFLPIIFSFSRSDIDIASVGVHDLSVSFFGQIEVDTTAFVHVDKWASIHQ